MKTIKTCILITTLCITSLVVAQPPMGDPHKEPCAPPPVPNQKQTKVMVHELAEKLTLSADQEKQMYKMYISHFKEVKKRIKESKKPNHEEMETLKMDFERDVKLLLTTEQQKAYDGCLNRHSRLHPPRPH